MIYLGLAAYNEQAAIDRVMAECLIALGRRDEAGLILLYNDGSTDDTLGLARRWEERFPDKIKVIDGGVNKGLGAGIKALVAAAVELAVDLDNNQPVDDPIAGAMKAVSKDRDDALVLLDADCTQNPELIWPMVDRIRSGYGLVIASRYRSGAKVYGLTMYRRMLSLGASWLMRTLYPIKGVRDYTCGFRCYSLDLLRKLDRIHGDSLITQTGFACQTELILKIRRLNEACTEVPMVLRYDAKPSPSKMAVSRTIRQVFQVMGRMRLGR